MKFTELYQQLQLLKESKESKDSNKTINIVTLFSGMGAPELALDKLGIKYNVVLASEIDDIASQIYHGIHGDKVQNFVPDVYKVVDYIDTNINKINQPIDLLVAGFCCQAYSGSGKGYGFDSRNVYPVDLNDGEQIKIDGDYKTLTIHFKKHLNPEIIKKGKTEHDNIYEVTEPEIIKAFKGNKYVKISPDSDGKLSLETLRVVKRLNPKIVILENVSAFGNAEINRSEAEPYRKEILGEAKYWGSTSKISGKSGLANFKLDVPDEDDITLFGKYLAEILDKMNYRFFPMYLDPTSYTKQTVGRRPRIYMVAIKNDIADKVGLTKSLISNDKPEKDDRDIFIKASEFFDIDEPISITKRNSHKIAPEYFEKINKEKQDYNVLLNQTFENILNDKEGNWFTDNPEQIFITLKSKLNSSIINFIKSVDLDNLTNKDINKLFLKNNIKKLIPSWRMDASPKIINLTDKSKEELYNEFISKVLTNNIIKKEANNQIKALEIGTLTKEDNLENIVEDVFNFYEKDKNNKTITYQITAIDKLKTIYKCFMREYIAAHEMTNYIPTILKNQPQPSRHGINSAAKYFIVFKDDKIYGGYLSPQQQLKIMGMTNKDLYKQMAKAANKAYNGNKELSRDNVKEITARIGNSMNVFVLEKLFSRLHNAGIL